MIFLFFGLAWNLSLSHLHCRLQLLFFQSWSHCLRLSYPAPSVSYKSFQTRPLSKDAAIPGEQSIQSSTGFHKGRLWGFRVEVHKSVMKNSIFSPQERSTCKTPVLRPHGLEPPSFLRHLLYLKLLQCFQHARGWEPGALGLSPGYCPRWSYDFTPAGTFIS